MPLDQIVVRGAREHNLHARQFLGQMEKPDVGQINGLSPAISIDQKGASRNPRSRRRGSADHHAAARGGPLATLPAETIDTGEDVRTGGRARLVGSGKAR